VHRSFNPAWNQGCLGARLSDLVTGNISIALVSNYMYEWGYFPTQCCPGLMNAKQVYCTGGSLCEWEGEAREGRSGLQRPACMGLPFNTLLLWSDECQMSERSLNGRLPPFKRGWFGCSGV
jgi:hypothetical protein